MKTLLIIPAYNEEENIQNVIQEVKRDLEFVDILVINDCSTDNTLNVLKEIQNIAYITLPINLGYSGALQTGFKYAVDNMYDVVIQFDGDGQHIASEARGLYEVFMEEKADIVIGSRFLNQISEYKHSILRTAGTKIFGSIIKKVCKQTITDPTSGFQVLSKEVFELYSKIHSFPEFPDANLLIQMILKGYKVREKNVKMRSREHGVSMHSGFIKPAKYMIKMFYSIVIIVLNRNKFIIRNH